jgi:GDP/UDP-N,N'-diacetylbacillosamine 2-epimerase (hydrolysing)
MKLLEKNLPETINLMSQLNSKKRKICFITGTRAEYGLLKSLMKLIRDSNDFDLQVIVTGMHLSPEFGLTYKEIVNDGFEIDRKVEILLSSDTGVSIAKSMGLAMISISEALDQLSPDILVILGDRFEAFACASCAMVLRIPIVHLHGGERTEGLIDEAIRHSITKMSFLHFVATDEYKKRVIQLGESPDRVINVGGLGVDILKNTTLISKEELEKSIQFKFRPKNLLVTFHPSTLENDTSSRQFTEVLDALKTYMNDESGVIFTKANSDTNGRIINQMIDDFVQLYPENSKAYPSLGITRYLSVLYYVDGVLGNSSSGIAEVPSFKKGTINIGDRQKGRIMADSVIQANPDRDSILNAINKLYSIEFQNGLKGINSPYGDGGASHKIFDFLSQYDFSSINIKKPFFDINFSI